MKCPTCTNATLVMTDRQGIEIDYCPQCRGVWLDRGELDKLIERSAGAAHSQGGIPQQAVPQAHAPAQRHAHYGYRKQKSWLSEIFD